MPEKVVFDCNVFTQALMNPLGPAGACVDAAIDSRIALYFSDFVLQEIRAMPDKPTPRRLGVTVQKAESLVVLLLESCERIATPPSVYTHPIDPDDSPYINLAIAAGARLIVSRDRRLLNLNNPAKSWGIAFRRQYPNLQIITAEALLTELRKV